MASEIIFPMVESKFDQSQNSQNLMNLFGNKDSKRNNQSEAENILDFENTERNLNIADERDLSKNKIDMRLQESPLEKLGPEDEISLISSRIEVNKNRFNNSTFDIMNSTRKNQQDSKVIESVKSQVGLKNRKGGFNYKESKPVTQKFDKNITQTFKRTVQKSINNQEKRKTELKLGKNSQFEKPQDRGTHKDSTDVIPKSKSSSLLDKYKSIKRRPGSAKVNPSDPLVLAKIQSSLALLKKSKKLQSNTSKSTLSKAQNSEKEQISEVGVTKKEIPIQKFKRNPKKKLIPKSDEKILPKSKNRKLPSSSPNEKILSSLFGNSKNLKREESKSKKVTPRNYNSSYISSLRSRSERKSEI